MWCSYIIISRPFPTPLLYTLLSLFLVPVSTYVHSLYTSAYAKHCLFIIIIIDNQTWRPFLQLLVGYGFGKTDSMAFVVKDRIIAAKENITYSHPVNHCQLVIRIQ